MEPHPIHHKVLSSTLSQGTSQLLGEAFFVEDIVEGQVTSNFVIPTEREGPGNSKSGYTLFFVLITSKRGNRDQVQFKYLYKVLRVGGEV